MHQGPNVTASSHEPRHTDAQNTVALPTGITYISWAADCSRSDHTARELGGTSHMVYWGRLGSHPATVWLKYLGQALDTWRILRRENPRAAFVMSPPLFAGLCVWAYCWIRRRPFVIDAHTAAFLHPRWKRWQWLQFWLCRRAATTIVTNEHLADLVGSRGARATIVPDVPARFGNGEEYKLKGAFNVAVVCSFNPDEPIQEMLAAAALLTDVHFYVTGNPKALRARFPVDIPPNVTLTGFLSVDAYGSLLRGAQVVMTLTTRDHTMLRGAWEAIYQGTPVIVSDWPILRRAFHEGSIHVDNTPSSIARAIEQLRRNYPAFRAGALSAKEKRERRWIQTREQLRARIAAV
jgi:glycosyltransferase involved in cell wall biosynthesis